MFNKDKAFISKLPPLLTDAFLIFDHTIKSLLAIKSYQINDFKAST